MAFKGTRRRSARDIAEAIENAGGDLNAETGRRADRLFRARSGRGRRTGARRYRRHSHRQPVRRRRTRAREERHRCRRSARSRTRPTIWSSICSPRRPGRVRRSAARSSARASASAHSIATRSTATCAATISAGATVVAGRRRGRPSEVVVSRQSRLERPVARQRGASVAGRLPGRRGQAQQAPRADPCRRRLRGARRSTRRTTTRRMFSPRRPAGACRRGSFRKCARSAASPIRSIRFTGIFRHRPLRLLRRLSRSGCAGDVIAASLDCLAEAAHRSANRKSAAPRRR